MNEARLNELIMARTEDGIKDIGNISEILKKLDIPTNQITIESNYFLNVAYATSDNLNLTVYTLFKRSHDKNRKLTVNILREELQCVLILFWTISDLL